MAQWPHRERKKKKKREEKRADWGRGIEGFPLLNQRQLSEGRQLGNKCCFTLWAVFQSIFKIYTAEVWVFIECQGSLLFAAINVMSVNSCMQQHYVFCPQTHAIIFTGFTQTFRELSRLYFLKWVIKKFAFNQTECGLLILHTVRTWQTLITQLHIVMLK